MKHIIKLGSTVDDLTGDYLRVGGEKINSNFTETFEVLGDGEKLYPAGAWKTHSTSDGASLVVEFGDAWIIDATNGAVTIILPVSPVPADYGKVIKLRDVKGSWSANPVVLQAGSGDYVGGTSSDDVVNTPYADITLVLADGELVSYDYKYIKGITIDSVPQASTGDTILKRTFLLTSPTADFTNIFDGVNYNIDNLEVFKNGNELYYGEPSTLPPTVDSDYGSAGGVGLVVPLNGSDVRLKVSGGIGDVIMFKTYLASIGAAKTTYQTYGVILSSTAGVDTNGEIINNVGSNPTITMAQLGAGGLQYNPGSLEVYLDGEKIPRLDSNGASNNVTTYQYAVNNPSSVYSEILLYGSFSGDKLLEVKWLNGNIGSTLEFEGVGGIQELTDELYMKTDTPIVARTNKINFPNAGVGDYNTTGVAPDDSSIRFSDITVLFDSIYPIGTIYKNAANPANPYDYMGFGTWVPHQVGKVEVGFESGDAVFGVNQATGGSMDKLLVADNIPLTDSGTVNYIKVDTTGDIDLTGCNTDPNSSPLVVKADKAVIGNTIPTALDITPAFVVVYSWRRIA